MSEEIKKKPWKVVGIVYDHRGVEALAERMERALNAMEEEGYRGSAPIKAGDHFVVVGRVPQPPQMTVVPFGPPVMPPRPSFSDLEEKFQCKSTAWMLGGVMNFAERVDDEKEPEAISKFFEQYKGDIPTEGLSEILSDLELALDHHHERCDSEEHTNCFFVRVTKLTMEEVKKLIAKVSN